jgi:hypothetical protein
MTLEVFEDTLRVSACPVCQEPILTGTLTSTLRALRLDRLTPGPVEHGHDDAGRPVIRLQVPDHENHYRRCQPEETERWRRSIRPAERRS